MDLDKVKEVGTFHGHLLPTAVAVLAALFFVFLMFKAETRAMKVLLFLTAAALLAGAYWWFAHVQS